MRPSGWCVCVVVFLLYVQGAMAGTVLVVGDSISAGFGLKPEEGWVHLLDQRLAARDPAYAVVNASISGDTSAGGLSRLEPLLARHSPAVVILELGGNDGLRGQPVAQLKRNLAQMTQQAQEAGAKVLILGMRLPPNYGRRYVEAFADVYGEVAEQRGAALVPFVLEGVGGVAGLMQADGVHPTASAQPRLLDNVWPALEPLL